eukprot:4964882-Alexandrium_andersonii.AAC.1
MWESVPPKAPPPVEGVGAWANQQPARTTHYVGPTFRDLNNMPRAPWPPRTPDGVHIAAPTRIERALDDAWGE